MATQLAGGIVAPMIGARRLLGSSVLLSAVLSLAIPMAASYGLVPVIMAQATIGLAQVSRSCKISQHKKKKIFFLFFVFKNKIKLKKF